MAYWGVTEYLHLGIYWFNRVPAADKKKEVLARLELATFCV
jgi:hypothetical protein